MFSREHRQWERATGTRKGLVHSTKGGVGERGAGGSTRGGAGARGAGHEPEACVGSARGGPTVPLAQALGMGHRQRGGASGGGKQHLRQVAGLRATRTGWRAAGARKGHLESMRSRRLSAWQLGSTPTACCV